MGLIHIMHNLAMSSHTQIKNHFFPEILLILIFLLKPEKYKVFDYFNRELQNIDSRLWLETWEKDFFLFTVEITFYVSALPAKTVMFRVSRMSNDKKITIFPKVKTLFRVLSVFCLNQLITQKYLYFLFFRGKKESQLNCSSL